MSFRNPSFSEKIIGASCAILILALTLFSTLNYYRFSAQINEQLQQEIEQVAGATAANMSNWLQVRLNLTQSTADRISRFSNETQQTEVLSLGNQAGGFKNLYYGTREGKFLIDDTNTDDLTGFDPRPRRWYQQASQASSATFSDPYHDAITKELLVTAAAPVQKGELLGVVGGDLSLKQLSDTVNSLDFKGLGFAFLINQQGNILAHPDSQQATQSVKTVFGKEIQLASNLQFTDASGQDRLVAFFPLKPLGNTQWYIGVDIDRELAMAPLYTFRTSAILSTLVGAIATIFLLELLLKQVTRPLQKLRNALFNIAQGEGDLTQRLSIDSNDELGQLAMAFNAFTDNIHMLIEDFKGSSENLATMVGSLRDLAEKSHTESDRQRLETDMVATAVTEMSAAAQQIAKHAQEAADAAQQADTEGQKASHTVKQAIDAINRLAAEIESAAQVITELEGDVTRISSMVSVIRGIAEQTNLLALNAAIEAARAGEQGRGFAVVADEVRTLASKTQDSTEEINRLIERLTAGSSKAVQAMTSSRESGEMTVSRANEAGDSLATISKAVSTISDMNLQIATASEEQTAVTDDISRSITTIADGTALSAASSRETAENSQRLAEIAASIQVKVNRFRV